MAIPNFDNGARDLVTVSDVANSPAHTTVTRQGTTIPTLAGALAGIAVSAGLAYETLAELQATTGTQGQMAEVTNDGDNTGRYSWQDGAWVKSLDTTSAKFEQVSQAVIENKFPSSWGDYVDGAFKSEDGAVLLGVKRSTGRYVGTPEHVGRVIGEKVLDPRYSDIEHDDTPERNIIWAKKWDGSTVSINDPVPSDVELVTYQSAQGRMQIKAINDDDIVTVASAFNSFNPKLTSGKIEYREKATVSTYTRHKEYPFSTFPVTATTLTHFIGYGESLAAGTGSEPTVTTPPLPDRLFMFNAGVLSLGREQDASAQHIVIDPAGLQNAEPGKSAIKESPVLAAAYQYAQDNPSKVVLVSQHGFGGALIDGLVRGNESYDNLIYSASMARAMAESNGMKYEIAPISFIQGTNDWATSLETYGNMLDTLWSQLNEDLKAVSGQSDDILLLLEQTLAGGGQNDGSLAFAQIEKWQQYPNRFHCSNPRYGYTYVDNSHLDGTSYDNQGASQGFACRADYEPLYPVSAVRTGTTVVVKFNEGGLVMDTTNIIPPTDGNFGFYWKDDTNSAVIADVALSDDTVTITLDQEPTGANPQIRIADRQDADAVPPVNLTGTGKRCCLRTASLGNDVLGNPVYKRAAIYRINVTQ